jgi:hypothetical protein
MPWYSASSPVENDLTECRDPASKSLNEPGEVSPFLGIMSMVVLVVVSDRVILEDGRDARQASSIVGRDAQLSGVPEGIVSRCSLDFSVMSPILCCLHTFRLSLTVATMTAIMTTRTMIQQTDRDIARVDIAIQYI